MQPAYGILSDRVGRVRVMRAAFAGMAIPAVGFRAKPPGSDRRPLRRWGACCRHRADLTRLYRGHLPLQGPAAGDPRLHGSSGRRDHHGHGRSWTAGPLRQLAPRLRSARTVRDVSGGRPQVDAGVAGSAAQRRSSDSGDESRTTTLGALPGRPRRGRGVGDTRLPDLPGSGPSKPRARIRRPPVWSSPPTESPCSRVPGSSSSWRPGPRRRP